MTDPLACNLEHQVAQARTIKFLKKNLQRANNRIQELEAQNERLQATVARFESENPQDQKAILDQVARDIAKDSRSY